MSRMESRALHAYRKNLADVVPLDRAAERDLARRWRTGSKSAAAKLVTACAAAGACLSKTLSSRVTWGY